MLRLPAVSPPPLDVSALQRAAASATGLDDFGSPTYRDGLEVFVSSLNDEAQLNEIGATVDGADADLAPDDAVGHVFSFVEPARG